MSGVEVDLDAFDFGNEVLLEHEAPPARRIDPEVEAAIEAERAAMGPAAQTTLEGSEEPVAKERPVRDQLRALVYASRTGGDPHVVSLHTVWDEDARANVKMVLCICDAGRFIAKRPAGCWAMVDARVVFGLPAVGGA